MWSPGEVTSFGIGTGCLEFLNTLNNQQSHCLLSRTRTIHPNQPVSLGSISKSAAETKRNHLRSGGPEMLSGHGSEDDQ